MPKKFDDCVKGGGEVRTLRLSGRKYRRVCWDSDGQHLGHIKTRKKKKTG